MGITNLFESDFPDETNWLIFKENNIDHLQWSDSLSEMKHINLANSNIHSIDPNFFSKLANSGEASDLNLEGNKLKGFNQDIQQSRLSKMYLSGNAMDCNCQMFWFAQ